MPSLVRFKCIYIDTAPQDEWKEAIKKPQKWKKEETKHKKNNFKQSR